MLDVCTNADQNSSEYGHFLRSVRLMATADLPIKLNRFLE